VTLEHLARLCSSKGGQRRALEGLENEALRNVLTPAGAVALGAVPVAECEGRLVFATVPFAHPDCRTALEAALSRPVMLLPFNDALVRDAIVQYYLRPRGGTEGLDLSTFESPDFLRDPVCARKLLQEKDGALPEREIELPRGCVALIDLRTHSVRRPLDRPSGTEFVPAPSMLAFKLDGEGAVLFRDRMPPSKVRAIVSHGLFYDGDEHLHALGGKDLTKLPHVLHPSELQLAEIRGDEAAFWVYDELKTVRAGLRLAEAPGRPIASWTCRYYFLHFGMRYERTLTLDVLAFVVVKRSRLRLASRRDTLVPGDLERLFGLDMPMRPAVPESVR